MFITIEHHANIVPWQQLAVENGAVFSMIPVDDGRQVVLDKFEKLLRPRTRLLGIAQVSNAHGNVLASWPIVAAALRYGARVPVDGAQSVSHRRTDVQALDCDLTVFLGPKVLGPTGIGADYGRPDASAEAPAWQPGWNMIVDVAFEKTIYHAASARFVAGTDDIADVVGLATALESGGSGWDKKYHPARARFADLLNVRPEGHSRIRPYRHRQAAGPSARIHAGRIEDRGSG